MRSAAQEGSTGLEKVQLYIRYQMREMCGNNGPVAILSEIPSLKHAHRTQILERARNDSKTLAGFIDDGKFDVAETADTFVRVLTQGISAEP